MFSPYVIVVPGFSYVYRDLINHQEIHAYIKPSFGAPWIRTFLWWLAFCFYIDCLGFPPFVMR